jgi:methionyl-tRNA synthetase
MGGAKMSKSLGNVARYQDYVEVFGLDALRYFVMREMPLGQDANFSDEIILTRFNADLANDLGNLVSRAITMIHRYREGRVPPCPPEARDTLDRDLIAATESTIASVKEGFRAIQVSQALQDAWALVRHVNKFIVERAPWVLAKDPANDALLDRTLYHAADALRVIAALLDPVMPDAAERIRRMLNINEPEPWNSLTAGALAAGTQLNPVEALFPRIEKTIEELRSMTTSNDSTPAPSPAAPPTAAPTPAPAQAAPVQSTDSRISIDDFMKVELRVAKVLEAEAVPKSKKLVKLRVDVGTEHRTIVAGIAEAYPPDQLIGRTIVIVANLKPAKLMGIESNGMVLAASPEGGPPNLVAVDPSLPPGSRVR